MKRIFSGILTVIMLFTMIPLTSIYTSAAAESDLFEYTVGDDGNATITGYKGNSNSVNIPGKIDGYIVTTIGKYAFENYNTLESITVPDSVTTIEYGAFCFCESLESIAIPDTVTTIGGEAFAYCESLKSITLPNGVTKIADGAFYGCMSLKNITLPNKVTEIADYAFIGCASLESITIPNGVTKIGDYTFYGCESLKSIIIPNGITEIGYCAFSGCALLKSVMLPDSVTKIADSAFTDCASLESIAIPDGVAKIGEFVFKGCASLKSITIPKSVVSIGAYAFSNSAIETIYGYKGTYAENYANEHGFKFYEITEDSKISYENGYAFGIAAGTAVSEIKNGVTAVKDGKGNEVDGIMKTGYLITKDGEDYTVIILGDVSCDGNINSTDFMQIRKSFLGTFKLDDAKKAAADVNGDGKINSTDFMQIRKHFLGTYNIDDDNHASMLKGKTLFFLGSSVTYGSASGGVSMADIIGENSGAIIIKEAVSGTTLVDNGKLSYVRRVQKEEYKSDKVDIFICQLSTNDATLGFSIDDIKASIEFIISYAKSTWNCPVIFYTGTKYNSETYEKMVDCLYSIQKKWDIGIIDLWNDEQMNSVSKEEYAKYMADPIHPTLLGYKEWWVPKFEEYLKTVRF